MRSARDLRGIFLQCVDLGIRIGDLDLPLEVHFNGFRRLRIEGHGRIIHRHDVEVFTGASAGQTGKAFGFRL